MRAVASRLVRKASAVGLGLALLTFGSGTSNQAQAQSQSFNPYYSNGLESYAFPSQPNNLALPNQVRFSTSPSAGRYRYNQFERFREQLEGFESGMEDRTAGARGVTPRTSRPGVPYYESYRQFDQPLNRVYTPNASTDAAFYERQQERNARYFDALKERDPAKRAQMLREIDRDAQLAARNSSVMPKAATSNRPGGNTPQRMEPAPPRSTTGATGSGTGTRPGTATTIPGRTTTSPTTRRPSALDRIRALNNPDADKDKEDGADSTQPALRFRRTPSNLNRSPLGNSSVPATPSTTTPTTPRTPASLTSPPVAPPATRPTTPTTPTRPATTPRPRSRPLTPDELLEDTERVRQGATRTP